MTEPVTGNIDPTGTHTLRVIAKANRFNQWMYTSIRPLLQGELLEIGSGIGNISQFAIRDHFPITLSDISSEYKTYLERKYSSFPNVKGVLSIDLQHEDFFNHYASLKEKFDTVFLLNVIEHLRDDLAAIENCRFLLKQGGNLIVLAPAFSSLYCRFDKELGHYRRYTRKKLLMLFSPALFSIAQSRYFNFAGLFGWFWFGKILNRKMIGAGEMNAYEKLVPLFKLADSLVVNKTGLSVIVTGRKK